MNQLLLVSTAASVALLAALFNPAQAQTIISKTAPFGSSTTIGNGADWFELTNKSPIAINITGWRFDDNGNSRTASAAMTDVTSLAPKQSVVFAEVASGTTATAVNAAFTAFWVGSNVASNFVIGIHTGTGLGISQTADAVNIYNAGGTLVTAWNSAQTAGLLFPTTRQQATVRRRTRRTS